MAAESDGLGSATEASTDRIIIREDGADEAMAMTPLPREARVLAWKWTLLARMLLTSGSAAHPVDKLASAVFVRNPIKHGMLSVRRSLTDTPRMC
mmetsp:Transcript_146494/g.469946  ORF Transcript_146494/g.469946 Transcript_146494/m.469946 type:complete len:95 (+) Transcript_146494:407-691(+)